MSIGYQLVARVIISMTIDALTSAAFDHAGGGCGGRRDLIEAEERTDCHRTKTRSDLEKVILAGELGDRGWHRFCLSD
jgi:hypothetical protein